MRFPLRSSIDVRRFRPFASRSKRRTRSFSSRIATPRLVRRARILLTLELPTHPVPGSVNRIEQPLAEWYVAAAPDISTYWPHVLHHFGPKQLPHVRPDV